MSCLLSSAIINKLSKKNPQRAIAYFFFDRRDSQSDLQLHNKLIQSLISQFSHLRGGIPTELADLYKRCGDHQQLSVNQLQNTLRDILNGFSHAYIAIDALDKCTNREKMLNWVNKLVWDTDQKAENLHIAVTSRPLQGIEKFFEGLDLHSVDVGAKATANPDIMNYVKLQMESKFEKYNENTWKEIESRLREQADGL